MLSRANRFIDVPQPGNVAFNFLGDPLKDLTAFALGYKEAAHVLARRFAKRHYADFDGYPILFLYRHSLELYLKAIVYRGAKLMGLIGETQPKSTRLFKRHELGRLIPAVRSVFRKMDWDFNFEGSPFESFTEFEDFIEAIESVDAGSYSFRYPMNTQMQAQLPAHLNINIVVFSQVTDKLLEYLDSAAQLLEEGSAFAADDAYEVQQYLAENGEN